MRLGVNLGYWGAGNDAENLHLAREADTLGYAVAWAAEAYGSDAVTVLSWVAAQTERIATGTFHAIAYAQLRQWWDDTNQRPPQRTNSAKNGRQLPPGIELSVKVSFDGWQYDAPLSADAFKIAPPTDASPSGQASRPIGVITAAVPQANTSLTRPDAAPSRHSAISTLRSVTR